MLQLKHQQSLKLQPRDATVSITPSSIASPAVGQQLEFSLNITGGEAVAGYEATVQFDDTALRYVSGANGDFLPAGAFFVEPKVEGNFVKLNAVSLAGESNGDGTFATLTFEVITVKASTLVLSDVLLTNSAGDAFVPNVENAEITEPIGLKEDVNGDGIVNIQDLVLVASNLGKTGQNAADVNGDGQVNIQDLVLVAGALGTSAAAPSLFSSIRISTHRSRCQTVAISSTAPKPYRSNISERYSILTRPLSSVDTQRDDPITKLPQSVQSRNMDTVSLSEGRRCFTAYLCCKWHIGTDVRTWTPSCWDIPKSFSCSVLGWQKRIR